jgi:hypothetical protein
LPLLAVLVVGFYWDRREEHTKEKQSDAGSLYPKLLQANRVSHNIVGPLP